MKSKLLLILLACLILIGAPTFAKNTPTVTPVNVADLPVRTMMPGATGQVGNLNPPYWAVSYWFTGEEAYKILFNPLEQLNCSNGFLLEQVHMLLDFPDTLDYPLTFPVWADLEDADWDPTLQCWIPGVEDFVSNIFNVTIDQPGTYDIAIPIDGLCAYMAYPTGEPYWYLLSMHFPELFTANLITDNFPVNCYSWNSWGQGWFDLVSGYGFPGNIIMWGDVVCCDDPVDAENKSWGDIKSLFR